MMDAKEAAATDEDEPCLGIPLSSSPDCQFSSISRRKPDYTRRCIVVLLIHAVFILAVLMAFLIGHWISEQEERERLLNGSLTTVRSPTSTVTHPTLLTTSTPAPTAVLIQRIVLLPPEVNYTIEDVDPPLLEANEFLEELHSGTFVRTKKDTILVPLPLYILPYHYDLLVDLSRFSMERIVRANITILLQADNNSTQDEIQFHVSPQINIERIRLRTQGSDKRIYPKIIKREESKKLARIILRENVKKGKYFLDIEYNMTICSEDDGIHCNVQLDGLNISRVESFTTKFEPALARSFFPCWDDPSIKTTFNMSVLHANHLTVLSNMPSISTEEHAGRMTTTHFQKTPPMSTYLLALAVGEFVKLEMRTERNIPITIWTHREDFLTARFAANFSPIMFDRHEDELEVPYPLPKIDLVAARSFPVGGMENWGLIIFDQRTLLLDQQLEENENMSVDRVHHEYRIEKIITHELAHQWFGNLVTMSEWSDIWMNEGFASYYVYELLKEDHPQLTDNEYYTRLAELIRKQSGTERRALVRPLNTEQDVEQAFHSAHLYTKGCVIVRMMKDLVSEFDFRSGVRRYLRKNAYRTVRREDLWASLPAYADHGAEHERLSEVMEGWLINEGLPEVKIVRNYDNDLIRVSQRQSGAFNHAVFLKDIKPKKKNRIKREMSSEHLKDAEEEIRGTTPFDDSLFNLPPTQPTVEQPRRTTKRRRKKIQRIKTPHLPIPDILIDSRREDLRKPRRARDPSDLWSIPFSYMFGSIKSTEGQVVRQFWLKNRSVSFADIELSPNQALLANPEWAYPYRVNYDMPNWKMIARLLHQNHKEVPTKSRMQIILDAELFLAQSDVPHLYIYMLGYLSQESDLGVALFGLDAVHRLVDAFKGTSINQRLLVYLSPVITQMDKLLKESQQDKQLAALWLIQPTRLSKLYQLRCATNLSSCDQDNQTARWSSHPSGVEDDVHKQVTAVCHFLFTRNGEKESSLLESQLRSRTHWSTVVQLAACSQDEKLAKLAAKQVVGTKNAAIFASSLQSDFSLHYNAKFRTALWKEIGKLAVEERKLLFSVENSTPQPASKILIHSIKTTQELQQVRALVPDWGSKMSLHLEYVDRLLQWQDTMTRGSLNHFFSTDSTI